tara:strand:+ start:19746 stop:19946 length:201 start_codon:yes stop_codon:yes gene_type:complete
MKSLLLTVLVLTIILISVTVAFAQPPGLPSTPDQAPIDGGLGLLAVAGGAYAWKMLRRNGNEIRHK